ncbi:hypothetical protein MJ547_04505, partial [Burkholderia gladioli]
MATPTTVVPTATPDDLLSIIEAARVLGRSDALVETMIAEGSLLFVMGRRDNVPIRFVRRFDVEAQHAAMTARLTMGETQAILGVRSADSVLNLVRHGVLHQHPPLPHRGRGKTYDREEVAQALAQRATSSTNGVGAKRRGPPYTRWNERDRAALLAVLAAWPVLDDRSEKPGQAVRESTQGGRIYAAVERKD